MKASTTCIPCQGGGLEQALQSLAQLPDNGQGPWHDSRGLWKAVILQIIASS